MAKTLNKGDMYELRLARLLYVEGAFVRRAIDLNMRFGEDLTVTDLDILALNISPDFGVALTIGESKTAQGKRGPKLADRLLWLSGLRELVDADSAFVATAKRASDRVRGLAEKLEISVIDEQDLFHREQIHGLDNDSSWGPYDPRLLERQREVYESVKEDQELKRVYWFIRSGFWLLDTTTGVKRALGAMRILNKSWNSRPDDEQRASIRWLSRHLQVNIVVGLVRLASRCYREEPAKSSDRLLRELASGPNLDYDTMVSLSREVDRYLTAVLRDLNADPGKQVGALGVFNPVPPAYSESLIEVVERLAAEPYAATELPRFVDRRLAAIELGEDLENLFIREDLVPECDRLLRLIEAFVLGQFKISPELLDGVLGVRIEAKDSLPDGNASGNEIHSNHQVSKEEEESSSRPFDESTETLELQ